jgi:hypothetical protein
VTSGAGNHKQVIGIIGIVVAVIAIIIGALVTIYVPEIRCTLHLGACGRSTGFALTMEDFSAACQSPDPTIGYNDPNAVAEIRPSSQEPPAFWIKCVDNGTVLGGISLTNYCRTRQAGTHAYNPEESDMSSADQPWLKWRCAPN